MRSLFEIDQEHACWVAIPEPMWRPGLADKLLSCADFESVGLNFGAADSHAASVMYQNPPTKLIISTRSTKVEMARPEVCLNLMVLASPAQNCAIVHLTNSALKSLENKSGRRLDPSGQVHGRNGAGHVLSRWRGKRANLLRR